MNRFLLLTAGLLALPAAAWAQTELSNFTATGRGGVATTFATDYQAIGINPANLGRRGGAIGWPLRIGEVGAGVSSAVAHARSSCASSSSIPTRP